jgi:hypothetical protein
VKAKDRATTAASFARPLRPPMITETERSATTKAIESSNAIAGPSTAVEPITPASVIGTTLRHTWSETASAREKKKSGAPRRLDAYVRRTFTVNRDLSDYIDRAWRRYPAPDGTYAKGVSGFIEALIAIHRRENE